MLIIINFLNAYFHDCFLTEWHISGWLFVGALRAPIDLNGPDQPHWISMGPGGPFHLSSGPPIPAWAVLKGPPALAPSPGWVWTVQCGHVSSPVSCFSSPGSLALAHRLQLMDSVPSTWLCLPCSDPVGCCPTAEVTIYAAVTLSSHSLGK